MLFISCRKNDPDTKPTIDNPPVEKEKTCIPLSLKWRDSVIYKFHTNDLNQITEITAHSFAAYRGNTKIKYDEKGRVIEVEFRIKHGQTSTFHKYYYGESEQPQYRITFYENKKSVIDSFYYDSSANLVEKKSFIIKNQPWNAYEFLDKTEYTWYNNDKELQVVFSVSWNVMLWKFGETKNPFFLINRFYNYLYLYNLENMKFLPVYNYDPGSLPGNPREIKYSYVYNDLGYPLTILRQLQSTNDSLVTLHIDYICK